MRDGPSEWIDNEAFYAEPRATLVERILRELAHTDDNRLLEHAASMLHITLPPIHMWEAEALADLVTFWKPSLLPQPSAQASE